MSLNALLAMFMFMTAWAFEARHCRTLLNEIKKNKTANLHIIPSWHKHFVVRSLFVLAFTDSVIFNYPFVLSPK
jgi:hypothetical protein